MGSNADALDFNQQGIQEVVGSLENIIGAMNKLKESLEEYNNTNLKPHWSTAGSIQAQAKLEEFINVNIVEFIQFVERNKNNLQGSIDYVNKIDNAGA